MVGAHVHMLGANEGSGAQRGAGSLRALERHAAAGAKRTRRLHRAPWMSRTRAA